MAIRPDTRRVPLQIRTNERPAFKQRLAAYVFDGRGELIERADVRDGKVELPLPKGDLGKTRVFVAAYDERLEKQKPTLALMQRIGAYEPVLQAAGRFVEFIEVPGIIIDLWPLCFCWVRGRVVRTSDNRAVCDARVHICEVDRIPWWILRLPDLDVLRLRDDLLLALREPIRKPIPEPDPPFKRSLFRAPRALGASSPHRDSPLTRAGLNPQPLPPGSIRAFNPQPDPPRVRVQLNPQPEPPGLTQLFAQPIQIAADVQAGLSSASAVIVRNTLAANWRLILPWLCLWPYWWWRFRCDEVAVLTTDSNGRFETTIIYLCNGDHPDLYFWVEYDFGGGFETVYHPPLACHTYWNYACGTEVTIRVSDPRVPGCDEEPDLPGTQVVVNSIGVGIAVRQVQTAGAAEGLTVGGQPFGATLEPRVDFSRTELIDVLNIPYYRWSYRRLSAPDGGAGPVAAGSEPLGTWKIMTRDVWRHYKLGTSYPSDFMGPMPSGPGFAPLPDLFRIRPLTPPAGSPEWIVINEHVDLATAYFDTAQLLGAPPPATPLDPDLAAGRYEMKLELFTSLGALVNWTTTGIDLRITDQDAPFPEGLVTTSPAPAYNRILNGAGETLGFRMVVRVDNNRCYAEILPVGGDVTPDPTCGFHNYSTTSDDVHLSFIARHPNHFAGFGFSVTRGPADDVGVAGTTGIAGEAATNSYAQGPTFTYTNNTTLTVGDLLGPGCTNAAFAERLDVGAMATDGYSTLTGYNAADNAAFALAEPCDCKEKK